MAKRGILTDTHVIEETIISMATFVEELIAKGLNAMMHGDERLGEEVIAEDQIVDDFRDEVRTYVILAIEHWAPMGPALRRIIAYQLIADELERIGDYSVHIARSARAGFRALPLTLVGEISAFGNLVRQQVRQGVQVLAMADMADAAAARAVCSDDTKIDQLYDQITAALKEYMRGSPETIQETTQLIFTMHDLERIGDRVANICESVIFIATGKHEKLN